MLAGERGVDVFGTGQERIALGTVLGRGGEGVVYQCADDPARVVKLYAKPPTAEKVAKLQWMVRRLAEHPDLEQWCAWPQMLVHDAAGQCLGFRMARVLELRPIHEIYQPEQRKALLPMVGWDYLIRVAANCARMFASLHRHGVLVGDVNERNIFVDSDATVHLVDCDSFQVKDGETLYPTGVGVVDYTPPELQGRSFRGLERVVNHDRFGLAVILFKLVLMGRHPFSGGASGDLGKQIAALDFDYPQLSTRLRHLVPWSVLPMPVREAFSSAFLDPIRPDAEQWVSRLVSFETLLQPCRKEPLHKVPAGVAQCPWCAIEQSAGYAYFSRPQSQWQSAWQPPAELLAPLEAELVLLDPPRDPADWQFPTGVEAAMANARAVLQTERPPDLLGWYLTVAGGLAAAAGVAMALFAPERGVLVAGCGVSALVAARWLQVRRLLPWHRELTALEAAVAHLKSYEAEWKGEVVRFRDQDKRQRMYLADLRQQLLAVDAQRAAELAKLEGDQVPAALRDGLARFSLMDATIPGIAVEKKRALAIRGVLSAAHLDRQALVGIPGLLPAQVDALITWRRGMEQQLTGARPQGPSSAQLAAIDANFTHLRDNLLGELRHGIGNLRDTGQVCATHLRELDDQAQAEAHALDERVNAVRKRFLDE